MAWVLDSEPHIGERGVKEPGPGLGKGHCQQFEPLSGQRGEQTAPIGEVVRRRCVRHPRFPR